MLNAQRIWRSIDKLFHFQIFLIGGELNYKQHKKFIQNYLVILVLWSTFNYFMMCIAYRIKHDKFPGFDILLYPSYHFIQSLLVIPFTFACLAIYVRAKALNDCLRKNFLGSESGSVDMVKHFYPKKIVDSATFLHGKLQDGISLLNNTFTLPVGTWN